MLYHPQTEKQLDTFIESPVHGLLISGARGSGKTTTAEWLAAKLLGIDQARLWNYPYMLKIAPDDKMTIPIEQIRKIDHFLSVKVPSSANDINRIIIIDGAEYMSHPAQNAMLKNLEEPPKDTIFILTSSDVNALLDTVKSRIVKIPLRRIEANVLTEYLEALAVEPAKIKAAVSLSGGVPGLALSIANANEDLPLVKAANLARELISSNRFDRLSKVNDLAKQPILFKDCLEILQLMARAALESSNATQSEKWQKIQLAAYKAQSNLSNNANMKLNLTHFMITL